jgi:hypothetical protein
MISTDLNFIFGEECGLGKLLKRLLAWLPIWGEPM